MPPREDRWSHLSAPAFRLPGEVAALGPVEYQPVQSRDHLLIRGLIVGLLGAIAVALAAVGVEYAYMVH